MRVGVPTVLLVGLLSVPAWSEELPVATGTRVRVTTTLASGQSLRRAGMLTAIDDKTLTLGSGSVAERVPRADVTRVEVSVRPSRRGRGALIGLGIGTAIALGLAAACEGDEEGWFGTCLAAGMIVIAGPAAGIGALAASGEQWTTVPVSRLHTGMAPARGRRVGASIAFRF